MRDMNTGLVEIYQERRTEIGQMIASAKTYGDRFSYEDEIRYEVDELAKYVQKLRRKARREFEKHEAEVAKTARTLRRRQADLDEFGTEFDREFWSKVWTFSYELGAFYEATADALGEIRDDYRAALREQKAQDRETDRILAKWRAEREAEEGRSDR